MPVPLLPDLGKGFPAGVRQKKPGKLMVSLFNKKAENPG
jgi:hypothetical protein